MKHAQNSLRNLRDAELLLSAKNLALEERKLTTQVLHHLAEIERRKLYSDLRCPSLFAYAVQELGYSESAAGRRIQAMRLMKEVPEIEAKIESGALNLSHICQAQGFFGDIKRAEPERVVSKQEKTAILSQLENKSKRETESVLLSLAPPNALPRERERAVSPEHVEVRLVLSQEMKKGLERVRALLGARGAGLGLAELIAEMTSLSLERLSEKKFGKKRARATPASGSGAKSDTRISEDGRTPLAFLQISRPSSRHIPKAVKHEAWQRAGGKCVTCGSRHRLEFDHVMPVALGGDSAADNVRVLCSSCNIRRGVKTFGTRAMRRN